VSSRNPESIADVSSRKRPGAPRIDKEHTQRKAEKQGLRKKSFYLSHKENVDVRGVIGVTETDTEPPSAAADVALASWERTR
jgi:hypothetical protein